MSNVENYQKMKCAQVRLSDGNKVLVSYGDADMKVFQLGFLSMPKKIVHDFDIFFLSNLHSKIGYDLSKDIVKILADEIAKVETIDDVKEKCIEIESSNNFIENV